ncbi:MAG TPA: PilZ domain-containing protein [Acidimicrobiales bacterium]|nr:PilZ domain-containing protein [Acidimicrobiales bacterium]
MTSSGPDRGGGSTDGPDAVADVLEFPVPGGRSHPPAPSDPTAERGAAAPGALAPPMRMARPGQVVSVELGDGLRQWLLRGRLKAQTRRGMVLELDQSSIAGLPVGEGADVSCRWNGGGDQTAAVGTLAAMRQGPRSMILIETHPDPDTLARLPSEDQTGTGTDRRAHPRLRQAIEIEILLDDGVLVAETIDVSAGGLLLVTPGSCPEPGPVGHQLSLKLSVDDARLDLRGRVLSCRPRTIGGGSEVRVQFDEAPLSAQERIADLVGRALTRQLYES